MRGLTRLVPQSILKRKAILTPGGSSMIPLLVAILLNAAMPGPCRAEPSCILPAVGEDVGSRPSPALPSLLEEDAAGCSRGWPVFLDPPMGGFPYTLTLFDVNEDGRDELFCMGGETFGLDGDGSFLPGWPTSDMAYMGYATNDQMPGPSCADLEDDGICEVLWSERDWWAGSSHMWCFNGRHADGTSMEGFPQFAPDDYSNALDSPFVLGDADGDGDLEAWSAHTLGNTGDYYRISGFDHQAEKLFTTDLDPAEDILGLYFGDVDGSGTEEFFAVTLLNGDFLLHAFTPAGEDQPGFPEVLFHPSGGWLMFGSPIPVDLDQDEDLEIVMGYYTPTAIAEARHHDGSPVSGFPITISTGTQLFYLGLGDLTADGAPELLATGKVLSTQEYCLWALDLDAGLLPGWPVVSPGWPEGYPAVVEMDGDGRQEVCFVTDGGQMFAVSDSGVVEPGFPKTLDGASYSGVAAGDIDGDGQYELAAVSTTGWAYAWDTEGVVAPGMADWPMRGIDARNTGVFHVSGQTGVEGDDPGQGAQPGTLTVLENPATGCAVFTLPGGSCGTVSIYDLGGRMVGNAGVGADGRAIWVPAPETGSGLYLAVPPSTDGAGSSVTFVLLR
jgi:hypothetical protein